MFRGYITNQSICWCVEISGTNQSGRHVWVNLVYSVYLHEPSKLTDSLQIPKETIEDKLIH